MPDVFDTVLDAPPQQSGDIFDQVLAQKQDVFDQVLATPPSPTPETDKALAHTKQQSFLSRVNALAQTPSPEWIQPFERAMTSPIPGAKTALSAIGEIGATSPEDLKPTPVEDEITNVVAGALTPANIGLVFTGGSIGGAAARLMAAGFSAQAATGAVKRFQEYQETTDPEKKQRLMVDMVADGTFALLAGHGAIKGFKISGPKTEPATPEPPPVQTNVGATTEAGKAIPEPVQMNGNTAQVSGQAEQSLMPPEGELQASLVQPASLGRTEGMPAGPPITQRFQQPTGPEVANPQMAAELGLPLEGEQNASQTRAQTETGSSQKEPQQEAGGGVRLRDTQENGVETGGPVEPLISPKTGQPIPRQPGVEAAITEIQRRNAPEPVQIQTGVSKIGKSIETKAVEAKLTEGFKDTAGYDPITIQDQAQRATSLVQSRFPEARQIIRGDAPLPEGLRGTSLITAMEEHLVNKPDPQVAYELANSPLTSATSAAAQEMRLMAERVPDSLTAKFKEIQDARRAGAEQRGETPARVAEEIKTEIVKNSSKRPTWESFVKEIACPV